MSSYHWPWLSSTKPAAPAGNTNVTWQFDETGGPNNDLAASAYVPTPPTPTTIVAPNQRFCAWTPVGVGSVGDPSTLLGYYPSTFGDVIQNYGASGTAPAGVECQCNASTSSYAAMGEFGITPIYCGFLNAFQSALMLLQTTHSRMWLGISSLSGSSLQSDTPGTSGGQFVGFRYSTHASDSTWQAVTADGVSQTISNTGVSVDTNMHTFRIVRLSSSYEFYIDSVLVATNTTNLPTTSVGCFDIAQFDAPGTTSGTPGFVCSYLYWWSTF